MLPKYISTFELEEARLGQALQRCMHEMSEDSKQSLIPELLKKTLRKIREESVNAEFALDFVSRQMDSPEVTAVTSRLINKLLSAHV